MPDSCCVQMVLLYSTDREEGLKNAITSLENYCNEWKSEVNCDKLKIVIFGEGKTQKESYNFRRGKRKGNAETVMEYKYLGLLFNFHEKFRKGQLDRMCAISIKGCVESGWKEQEI